MEATAEAPRSNPVATPREQNTTTSRKLAIRLFYSLFGLALFAAALWFLWNELRQYPLEEIVTALRNLPVSRLLLALGLTGLDYFILTGFDFFGFRYIGKPMPYKQVGPGSFTAYAFSHTVGFSILSGGAVRYRWYSPLGISAGDVARIVLFCGVTYILGFLLAGGVALFRVPAELTANLHVPFVLVRLVGAAMLVVGTGYFVLAAKKRRPFRIHHWKYSSPGPALAAVQGILGVIDWILAASVLYVLLPAGHPLSYVDFLGLYCLAFVIGNASAIPGGLGVFETVLIATLGGHIHTPALVGSLIAFRAIYFLIPLMSASTLLISYEVVNQRRMLAEAMRRMN